MTRTSCSWLALLHSPCLEPHSPPAVVPHVPRESNCQLARASAATLKDASLNCAIRRRPYAAEETPDVMLLLPLFTLIELLQTLMRVVLLLLPHEALAPLWVAQLS